MEEPYYKTVPLYLKDLNGCNAAGKWSSNGTPFAGN